LKPLPLQIFATEKLLDCPQVQPVHAASFEPICFDFDRNQIQEILSQHAGIIKTSSGLKQAWSALQAIKSSALAVPFNPYDHTSGVLLEVGIMLIEDAMKQTRNRGVFYNEDLVDDLVP